MHILILELAGSLQHSQRMSQRGRVAVAFKAATLFSVSLCLSLCLSLSLFAMAHQSHVFLSLPASLCVCVCLSLSQWHTRASYFGQHHERYLGQHQSLVDAQIPESKIYITFVSDLFHICLRSVSHLCRVRASLRQSAERGCPRVSLCGLDR